MPDCKRIIFLFLSFILLMNIASAQLTIHVTSIPASTPPNDNIYIAGNFNNWNPGNAAYQLTDNNNGTFTITFSPQAGLLEYKFTRGGWDTVEGSSSGNYIPNRTYNYSGGAQTVNVSIAGWEGGGGNHTATDNVQVLDENFYMPQFNRTRRIWVYLPPDYNTTSKRYPVLYMHDGQNLFDEYYSFAGEWKIDESMNDLFEDGDYGAIVIGIDNGGGERLDEYTAWVNPNYGGGDAELYADFLVTTLKPHIDSTFRTLPGREFTGIAGSSLGGLVSMSAAIDHQDVFSKVGIFSPSFWFSDSCYLQVTTEGINEEMKFYFVGGDNESSSMVPDMIAMYDTLVHEGQDMNNLNLVHHPDGAHSEWYWAREYPAAYEWLFGDLILDIETPEAINSTVYPNPVRDFLHFPAGKDASGYSIYSPSGMLIRAGHAENDSIDVSFLQEGIYFLEVRSKSNKHAAVSRFIKQ